MATLADPRSGLMTEVPSASVEDLRQQIKDAANEPAPSEQTLAPATPEPVVTVDGAVYQDANSALSGVAPIQDAVVSKEKVAPVSGVPAPGTNPRKSQAAQVSSSTLGEGDDAEIDDENKGSGVLTDQADGEGSGSGAPLPTLPTETRTGDTAGQSTEGPAATVPGPKRRGHTSEGTGAVI